MKTRILTLVLVLLVGSVILAIGGFSATDQHKAKRKTISKYPAGSRQLTCEDINPEVGTIIQFGSIGDTWYDFQKNGSVGRMISVVTDGHRHFSWMYCDHPFPPGPRFVDANCKNPDGIYIGQGHADGGNTNAGYSNQTHLTDGISLISYHRTSGMPCWYSTLSADDLLCGGFFTRHWDIPDYITGGREPGMWPKSEVLHDPIAERDYIHIAMTEGHTPYGYVQKGKPAPQPPPHYVPVMVAYERCFPDDVDPSLLYCQTYNNGATQTYPITANQNGGGAASQISHFDYSCGVTPVVAVSPVSQRVAVAYLPPACEGTCDFLTDVAYIESENNGDDWIDGTQWPPVIHKVTDFGCGGQERTFNDVSACYDYLDSLHLVYVITHINYDYPGYRDPHKAWLYHWSKESGISMITNANWEGTQPDAHSCNIAKASIAAKDPIYHPEGDSVYLYCIWTQFDPDDNSASGYTNGDIYGSGSFDGGATWGGIFNLTNTKTPDCTPGNCVGEHWSSLAREMHNGDLHIQYICDKDAGAAVMGEGAWTENPVMYLHLTEWEIPPEPRGTYRIEDPEHWYHPPLKVEPNGSRTLIMKIFSIGNADLVFSVTTDHPCIQGTAGGTLAPGDSVAVTFTLDGTGACNGTFIAGHVILTTNEAGGTTVYLPVHAVVADDYYECPRDPETFETLENSTLRLYANANCEEWVHDILTNPDTPLEVFFDGGTIVATTSGTHTVVGRFIYDDWRAGARDKLYTEECDVDWEPDFWIMYTKNVFICPNHLLPPAHFKWFWWELSKQIKFFREDAPWPYSNIVIKYVRVKRHDPPGWWPDQSPFTDYEDTYIGVLEDMDCPSDDDAHNLAGYDPVNYIFWQQGIGVQHPEYNDYYCGIALAQGDMPGESIVPYGAYNQCNQDRNDEELYTIASTSGYGIENPGIPADRSWVLTARKIDAGVDPDDEASFTLVKAVAPNGLAELQEIVDNARDIVTQEGFRPPGGQGVGGLPAICGDVNGDGSVNAGDIVYLLSYLYWGGPPPLCPIKRADCNSDCSISAGDIVYLISYLFRNGPPPDCPGIWGPR